MHYGVVDAAGKRTVYQPIDLPGPRLPHDMAFTANYSILNDLPVFWDAGLLERDIHAVRLHKGVPSRFGIVPRHGGEVRWFEARRPMCCTGSTPTKTATRSCWTATSRRTPSRARWRTRPRATAT
jgi:hypothetical protein